MAILLRVCSFVFFIWFAVMLPTQGTSQDPASRLEYLRSKLAFKEPTHLMLSGQYTDGLQFAPIGSWDQFQEIPGLTSMVIDKPQSVEFDPVEQRVYWGDIDVEAIFRCKLDGSQVEQIFGGKSLNGLAMDSVNRRLYFSANRTNIQSINLDGTGMEILVNDGLNNYAVAIDHTRSRVYWSDDQASHIGRININGSDQMVVVTPTLYTYTLTVDEKGERLYWCQSNEEQIESSDLDGNNRTLHIQASGGGDDQHGLVFYQNQFIVADYGAENVVVWNFTSTTSTTSLEAGEQLPSVFGNVLSLCLFYKYEPPSPIFGIKLIQTVTKRGLLIARINVPIKVDMAGWTLEINFPRQVFDLKIFGCDVEIQDKSQTKPGGQRRGTKYTLISTPGSGILSLGSKLMFKMEAKTWQKRSGFKRGIFADLYPTPLVE